MPDPAQFVKAELEIEGSPPIPVLFNPTEFSISKSNDWKYDKVQGNALPKAQYGGGNPRELTLNLLLDKSLLSKTRPHPGHHQPAVQDDGGQGGPDGRLDRGGAAVRDLQVGPGDDVQVGLHAADRRLQALPPQRRPDPRRRQDDAQAGVRGDQRLDQRRQPPGQPDDARRTPATACTRSRTATRCPRSPTTPTATPPSGARSPTSTGSRTRCTCAAAAPSRLPKLEN